MFGQANGMLKIVSMVTRVAMETQTGGEIRTFLDMVAIIRNWPL